MFNTFSRILKMEITFNNNIEHEKMLKTYLKEKYI